MAGVIACGWKYIQGIGRFGPMPINKGWSLGKNNDDGNQSQKG
jgi:hypothetical protein